jgi:hypothetical protein
LHAIRPDFSLKVKMKRTEQVVSADLYSPTRLALLFGINALKTLLQQQQQKSVSMQTKFLFESFVAAIKPPGSFVLL